jgi:hypothetical protein
MDSDICDDSKYSDAELIQHIVQSPVVTPGSRVSLVSPNLLAKHYEPSEVEDAVKAMEIARQLGIRAPCTKRVVRNEQNAYCIIDRVEGTTLEDAWLNFGWFVTIKLALQLRHFITRLRSATSPTAGSLVSGECRSFWLNDRYGLPVRSRSENITCFFRFWTNFTSMRKAMQAAHGGKVMDSKEQSCLKTDSFVFTHHDLAPRNILLTSSSKLWLLDWDFAGFYPVYFEYASMQNFNIPKQWNFLARLRWYLFTWIAVGRYEQSARMLRHIRSKFTQYPLGRRFELLKIGGPYRYAVS